MAIIGITSNIFFILRQRNPSTQAIAKIIHNEKVHIRKAELGYSLPILAIVDKLQEKNFYFDYNINNFD